MACSPRLVAPIIVLLLPLGAHAASFDCRAARSPEERLVCATPALSALDDRLASAFADQIARLSPEGQDLLRRDERNWLAYTGQVCLPTRKPVTVGPSGECLQRAYEARVADLSAVLTNTAGWTFQIVTFRRAVPVSGDDDGSGAHPGFATNEVSYLRIDAPSTAAARQWNERLDLSPAAIPDTDTDVRTTMSLNIATPTFISATTEAYFYTHGQPHGHGNSKIKNVIMSVPLRDATPEDLFKPGGGWKTVIRDTALHQVAAAAVEDQPGLSEDILNSAVDTVESISKWQIRQKAVVVQFDPYELGTYLFSPTVTIPWASLSGELKPNSPIAGAIDLPAPH